MTKKAKKTTKTTAQRKSTSSAQVKETENHVGNAIDALRKGALDNTVIGRVAKGDLPSKNRPAHLPRAAKGNLRYEYLVDTDYDGMTMEDGTSFGSDALYEILAALDFVVPYTTTKGKSGYQWTIVPMERREVLKIVAEAFRLGNQANNEDS